MFTLDQVVPWGRSFDEYQRMFALTQADLDLRILGCGDGPASFNAETTRRGFTVVSVDPVYQWNGAQIQERIAVTRDQILEQTRNNAGEFIWDSIRSVEELGQIRMAAMQDFLDDYEAGKAQGRSVEGDLPTLRFDDPFDLALCSHFLFLTPVSWASRSIGRPFEKCRGREVRIFPLLARWRRSPLVDSCVDDLRESGCLVSIEGVPYEFQRGGNEMLRIRSRDANP